MASKKDNIFLYDEALADFVFDDKVASVFSDMINRSVPGYPLIVRMIAILAERFAKNNTNLYDLGCSLGAVSFLLQKLQLNNSKLIAVDNSQSMLDRCQQSIQNVLPENLVPIEFRCEDILMTELTNASIVVLNFTLQFIAPEHRDALITKIYDALVPGGILIISEKIIFTDDEKDKLFIDLHHRFKFENGYSELEISRKRSAIENVLIPETIDQHEERVLKAGFDSFETWFQCFNFSSFLAIKK